MATESWTSRRRVEATLAHREPDRVPFDLGGTTVTGIHQRAYRNLRQYLGLPDQPVVLEHLTQQLARVDEDLKARFNVDIWGLIPRPVPGAAAPPWTEGDYHKWQDEWAIQWWMPVQGGLYYDMRRHPLAQAASVADVEKFPWPEPEHPARFEGMAQRAEELRNQRQVAFVLGRSSTGLFEQALWLRGFEQFFCDMVQNVAFAEALLDKICELKMRYWAKALQTVGANVLIVAEADDLASQNACLVSPQLYRRLIKPRHHRLFAFIKKQAQAPVKIFFHSCGAVAPLLPDLIEAGIDILNPVQVSARGMDTRQLKRQFGHLLCFYGGGVDTQQVLPRGTPQQVRDEVRRRVDDLAPGGGFIFAAVHNIQADVPPQNIVAMWEALQEFGLYG